MRHRKPSPEPGDGGGPTQVFTYLDIRGLTTQALEALGSRGGLPPRVAEQLQGLAGPIASGVESFTRTQVGCSPW
jgi:hypothetical protein